MRSISQERTALSKHLADCTVQVQAGSGIGTAFFVAPGRLLTCRHVIQPDWQTEPRVPDEPIPIKLIGMSDGLTVRPVYAEDPQLDALILEVDYYDHPCARLIPDLRDNDPIWAYGYQQIGEGFSGVPLSLTYICSFAI